MDAQRTPDELNAENALICERLLKWKPARLSGLGFQMWRPDPYGDDGAQWAERSTPSFDTWADAGLILDALPRELEYVVGYCDIEKQWYCGQSIGADTYADTGPVAIRAAALEYIRSLP